jgi:hypothetical protein
MVEPNVNHSELEWHGNFEMDIGQVRYSFSKDSLVPEKVYDWRGRFVFGPMWTHKLGDHYFLRVTGQPVAWIREDYQIYQINVDDVYVQIGQKGVWDLMAGRFLTWRVFRKGLGFDLYTLEDTGARFAQNFNEAAGFFPHVYEVNTVFLRDGNDGDGHLVPPGRAAFHFYPTSWSGIEATATYGRLQSGGNVLGGRLAAGLNLPFVNALAGAEYVTWRPGSAVADQSNPGKTCDTCGDVNSYGFGGSIGLTPVSWLEVVGDYAYRQTKDWGGTNNVITTRENMSKGGYLQLDPGLLIANRSFIVGAGYFHVEYLSDDNPKHNNRIYETHNQLATYLVYPLGFNNALVKLVYSRATGHYEKGPDDGLQIIDGEMWSVRLRVAFYF